MPSFFLWRKYGKERVYAKIDRFIFRKKRLSMKGENTEFVDKQIKDLKKEYAKVLLEEKKNDQYKRK